MAKKKKARAKPRRRVGTPSKAAALKKFRAAAQKRRAFAALKARKANKLKVAKAKAAPKLSPKAARKAKEQLKKADALLAHGRQRGFVTYDEILKAYPNIETDVAFLEELYEKFSVAHIDVLEGGGMLEITEEPLEKGYARSDSSYDSIQM